MTTYLKLHQMSFIRRQVVLDGGGNVGSQGGAPTPIQQLHITDISAAARRRDMTRVLPWQGSRVSERYIDCAAASFKRIFKSLQNCLLRSSIGNFQ